MPPVYRARHCRRRDRTDSQRRTHGRRRQHTTVDLPGSLTIRVIRTLFAADAQVANWHSTVRLWPERRFSVAAGTTDLGGEKAFEMARSLEPHEARSISTRQFHVLFGSRYWRAKAPILRQQRTAPAMMAAGMHTQKNSLHNTLRPRALKNESPMGETLMGRNEKK